MLTEAQVDTHGEYIEIRYGDLDDVGSQGIVPVVRVALGDRAGTFVVEYLVVDGSEQEKHMLDEVRREMEFYLVEKGEHDPWVYAQYHCSTASNLYGRVHWLFFGQG